MKVIFLDIDGVLLTTESYRKPGYGSWCGLTPDPNCVRNLNQLIEDTGAVIVVSSAWRLGQDREDLAIMLEEWGVTGKVADRTPYFPREVRGTEIQHWLCKQAEEEIEGFVILDDEDDMASVGQWLVRTTSESGFTDAEREKAIAVINSGELPDLTRSEAAWETLREALTY